MSSMVCMRGPKTPTNSPNSRQSVIFRTWALRGFRKRTQSFASSKAVEISADDLSLPTRVSMSASLLAAHHAKLIDEL